MIGTIENIINNFYDFGEKLLPFLIPLIKFILPVIVFTGDFLREFIGSYLFPWFPLSPDSHGYIFWIILSALILIAAIIMAIFYPKRKNIEEI